MTEFSKLPISSPSNCGCAALLTFDYAPRRFRAIMRHGKNIKTKLPNLVFS